MLFTSPCDITFPWWHSPAAFHWYFHCIPPSILLGEVGFGRCKGSQLPGIILQNFISSMCNVISLLGSDTGSNLRLQILGVGKELVGVKFIHKVFPIGMPIIIYLSTWQYPGWDPALSHSQLKGIEMLLIKATVTAELHQKQWWQQWLLLKNNHETTELYKNEQTVVKVATWSNCDTRELCYDKRTVAVAT